MKIHDSASFGESLRKQRKRLRVTQAMLAEHTGFSVSFISDLENGKPTAELGKAIYLANLLGLDVTLTERGGGQ
ncbi:MAG: helix-turn-helix transcriptional regulator [Lachnospiraceae bacterium]|nr:helix-turn-helix transcriptional regulator [Lachnospiraceae bacterium]MBQ9562142.1 helix-turn-helix transcriptional regulator [Lachnospiraceae bacterium]MBQ9592521.1 helix-turn-helix transcriptional regulator [Lachnospiraceae bacterium]MBR0152578.1 helix-turn-helix transcriptional regulator [Lachnospiraceae bacterium]